MNKSYFKIVAALFLTAIIFLTAAILSNMKKRSIAPAFRLIAHEYKAEAAIANQMRKLKDYNTKPVPQEQEMMEGYKIDFQPAKKQNKWFYRLILTNPDNQRLLQIIADPEYPDIFLFE